MLLESAQMLNNGIHKYNGRDPIYRKLMTNHPCSKWALKSKGNFKWLLDHAYEINRQFEIRFKNYHKSKAALDICKEQYEEWEWKEYTLTPFAQAMPIIYRHVDTITAYRSYIKGEKLFAKWAKGVDKPDWYDSHEIVYDAEGLKDYIKRGLPIPVTLT